MELISVDPFRCRVWHLHDRMEEHINEHSCRSEIDSINDRGQLIPTIGRRTSGDADVDVEIVCGARRLFIARHMKVPLMVELRELSDREAILAMDAENRHRRDLSPYERSRSYARWLREGYFHSQEELAEALKVSASQVSRLLKLSRLPSVIVDAFGSAVDICEGWGLELAEVMQDPDRRARAITKARSITSGKRRPAAADVYRQLIAATAKGRKVRSKRHDIVIRGTDGSALFRISHRRNAVSLVLPLTRVSSRTLKKIQDSVASIIESPDGASKPVSPVRLDSAAMSHELLQSASD